MSLAQHNFLDDARKQGNQLPSSIAHQRRNEVAVGDALLSNYRTASLVSLSLHSSRFCALATANGPPHGLLAEQDYALSIATIHHFSTPARRVASIAELIRIVRPVPRSSLPSSDAQPDSEERGEQGEEGRGPGLQKGSTGRFLVFVWALEQRGESRRKFDEDAQPGEGDERQDLLVPWVLKSPGQASQQDSGEEKVHQRCKSYFIPMSRSSTLIDFFLLQTTTSSSLASSKISCVKPPSASLTSASIARSRAGKGGIGTECGSASTRLAKHPFTLICIIFVDRINFVKKGGCE